jgi:gamma-glutamyl-gamma-aminobutyrate hydrolase PuuD
MSRPVIGITTYVEPAKWGSWDRDAALLPHSYVAAVVAAGGAPVLLPPVPGGAEAVIAGLDGLLISGGADVDPARYGQGAHATTDRPRADRDTWETDLLRLALDRSIPVLAICRGLQVLNVTLHQHLPEVCGHDGHRPVPGTYGTTDVELVAGTKVADILGPAAVVPCHHHQAVDRVADGLVVSGRAGDGTIEAMELDDPDRWVVAVQWHPEDGADPRLAEAFVAEARRSGGGSPPTWAGDRRHNEEGRTVS